MTMHKLAVLVTKAQASKGKNRSVNIAQTKESLRLINDFSFGLFAKFVKVFM